MFNDVPQKNDVECLPMGAFERLNADFLDGGQPQFFACKGCGYGVGLDQSCCQAGLFERFCIVA